MQIKVGAFSLIDLSEAPAHLRTILPPRLLCASLILCIPMQRVSGCLPFLLAFSILYTLRFAISMPLFASHFMQIDFLMH